VNDAKLKIVMGPLVTGAQGPLYQQIVEAIKREVAGGRLTPGSVMPSFRALAAQLAVSLITVKRAYEELEREGIIVLHQGLGTFVAPRASDRSRSERRGVAAEALRAAVRAGRDAGLGDRELLAMLRTELASAPGAPLGKVGGHGR